jgi:hypothetical protein
VFEKIIESRPEDERYTTNDAQRNSTPGENAIDYLGKRIGRKYR